MKGRNELGNTLSMDLLEIIHTLKAVFSEAKSPPPANVISKTFAVVGNTEKKKQSYGGQRIRTHSTTRAYNDEDEEAGSP